MTQLGRRLPRLERETTRLEHDTTRLEHETIIPTEVSAWVRNTPGRGTARHAERAITSSMHPSPHDPQPVRSWLYKLTPRQQIGYGCLAVVLLGTLAMYCAGTFSLVARPLLLAHSTPTDIVPPTLLPTPTQQAAPTFLNLPPGTLVATPTQAPIPTREPPTITPTIDLTNPPPTPSLTPSPAFDAQTPPVRSSPSASPTP